MNPVKHSTPIFRSLLFSAAVLFSLFTETARAQQTVPVTLKNGQLVELVIVSLGGDHINWKYPTGGNTTKLLFKDIDGIEFPPTDEWALAMADLDEGDYVAATEKFKKLSLTKGPSTYYPAPGNFTNLAQRRLIDCYRRLRKPDEIALLRPRIEWEKIPSKERKIGGVVACWGLAGGDDSAGALKLIEEESAKLDWTDPLRGELSYIRAIVHRKMGDEPSAVVAFGEAYGAYPGVDPDLSADAMMQAVTILSAYPDRKPEMDAVIQMYAGMFGDGKLWDDAPADIVAVLSKDVEMLGIGGPGKNKNKNKLARGRFVRIELIGPSLSLAEVEVFLDEKNIAGTGKATQRSTQNNASAKLAIDGNTDGKQGSNSYSLTQAGDKETKKWWELDLGTSKVIDKIIVWNREGEQASKKLENFDIMVFSEDRKLTIFEQRRNKGVGRKIEFVINADKVLEQEKANARKKAGAGAAAPAAKEEE